MVSPQQEEVLRVFNFVGQQKTDGFQRLLPPVHVVAQEQVVAFWREASILKQPQQIIVLPVDVTYKHRDHFIHLQQQIEQHTVVFWVIICNRVQCQWNQRCFSHDFILQIYVSSVILWWTHMYIQTTHTTDLERGLQLQENGLTEEDLPGLEAQSADLVFLELHILARLCSSDCGTTTNTSQHTRRAEHGPSLSLHCLVQSSSGLSVCGANVILHWVTWGAWLRNDTGTVCECVIHCVLDRVDFVSFRLH